MLARRPEGGPSSPRTAASYARVGASARSPAQNGAARAPARSSSLAPPNRMNAASASSIRPWASASSSSARYARHRSTASSATLYGTSYTTRRAIGRPAAAASSASAPPLDAPNTCALPPAASSTAARSSKFTLHRVRPRVPAAATSPARVVVHGELARQCRHEHRVLRTIIEPAADQYHRWPGTLALIRDLRPIGGRHGPDATVHAQKTTGVGASGGSYRPSGVHSCLLRHRHLRHHEANARSPPPRPPVAQSLGHGVGAPR